jgi:trans-aconitate methyltransferase
MQPKVAGIVWFKSQADYGAILAISEDAGTMAQTYDAWLTGANKIFEHVKSRGMLPIRAEIDPETFAGWCKGRSLRINAQGRSEFANWKAVEYLRDNGMI